MARGSALVQLEVYSYDGPYSANPPVSAWVATANITTERPIHLTAAERDTGTRNGEVPIRFFDPVVGSAERQQELTVRPAHPGGTTSYYRSSGLVREYDQEFFPVATLQVLAGFDPHALRASWCDSGEAVGQIIKINGPPQVLSPVDPEDIAL